MAGPGATEYVVIDGFLIDCSLNENHSFDADVTEFPVESGSNIVDNIRPLPIVVEMECLVTNTPIGPIASSRTGVPVEDAYDLLIKIRDRREPVTIQTSLRTYEKMALKSLNIPRGPGSADMLRFTASFVQISIVENKRTIRVSTPVATGNGGGGKGGKKTVTKPPKANGSRLILIDKTNGTWFDPDYRWWTAAAKFETFKRQTVADTGDGVIYNAPVTVQRWQLYRSASGSVGNINMAGERVELEEIDTSEDASAIDRLRYRRADIIAVPLNKCVLNGFVIKTPPGTSPPTSARTDAAR